MPLVGTKPLYYCLTEAIKTVDLSAFFTQFKANLYLNDIEDLSPEMLQKRGLKGVIFDLDDTLIPEHTGQLSRKVVKTLETMKAAGIKTGIITNNFSSRYCEKVRDLLAQDGLFIPMIENAFKPQTLCFEQMLDFFSLQPSEVAMVGDGILTDTYGAKKVGLFSIRVNWFSSHTFKKGSLLFLREVAVCTYDIFRRAFFRHKSVQYHMLKNVETQSFLFIVNPKSSQTDLEAIKALIEDKLGRQSAAKYKIQECHDFTELASLYADDLRSGKYSCVVAVGGDGTVREAISLIENNWSISLGIIPTGTGNLLAKSLNIPNEPSRALEVILEGKQKRIDITKVNKNYITLVVGAGLDANIMKNTTSEKKKMFGVLAYCIEAIKQVWKSQEAWFALEIDGKRIWKRAIGIIAINRNSYIQAFLPQVKMPEENNGLLDVCILKAKGGADYLAILTELFSGSYKENDSTIEHHYAKTLKIRSWPLLNVQADGDYIGKTPIKLQIYPNRLLVMVPETQ